jgi:hypothetical protein
MSGTPVDEGSQSDKRSIPLSTKRRTWIKNIRKPERLPQAMKEAERYARTNCPGIETRSLSSSYNCVGMVFGSRRTIIEPEEIPTIFKDDEYYPVAQRGQIRIGDLVVYKKSATAVDIDHIGLIVEIVPQLEKAEVRVRVLSQWGFDGEYLHDEDNVPLMIGKHREYYSERMVP